VINGTKKKDTTIRNAEKTSPHLPKLNIEKASTDGLAQGPG
jgi:hypothetical protein